MCQLLSPGSCPGSAWIREGTRVFRAAEQLGPLITRIGSGHASQGLRALSHFPRNQIPRAGGRGGGCTSLRPGAGQDWAEAKTRTYQGLGGQGGKWGAGFCWPLHRLAGPGERTCISVPQFLRLSSREEQPTYPAWCWLCKLWVYGRPSKSFLQGPGEMAHSCKPRTQAGECKRRASLGYLVNSRAP